MEMFWAVLLGLGIIVFLIAIVALAVMLIQLAITEIIARLDGQDDTPDETEK